MDYKEIKSLLLNSLVSILERKTSLFIFAIEQAHFEGWLKVEICEILSNFSKNIVPEKSLIDLTFDNWLFELKTISTGYKSEFVKNKGSRRITEKVQSIINDIIKLKNFESGLKKAVLFIVYPNSHDKPEWQYHLAKIEKNLKQLDYRDFKFKGMIPGVIYLGLIE
ncbi:MAG: hypothetical protein ACTSRU_12780 [Candidatus Hodarchaeales archaeon]